MTNIARPILLIFLSLFTFIFTSCEDYGGYLSVVNVEVLDTNNNPVENIYLVLEQDGGLFEDNSLPGAGVGPASFITNALGQARISFFSREGTATVLIPQAEVYEGDPARFLFCNSTTRIFEGSETDVVIYVNPPTIPVSIDLSNALQDSSLLGGKDFAMGVFRSAGGCFVGLASRGSTELQSDSIVNILVYPNSTYNINFFNRDTGLQLNLNFSVDSTAQTISF
jgi:hypothetical protein